MSREKTSTSYNIFIKHAIDQQSSITFLPRIKSNWIHLENNPKIFFYLFEEKFLLQSFASDWPRSLQFLAGDGDDTERTVGPLHWPPLSLPLLSHSFPRSLTFASLYQHSDSLFLIASLSRILFLFLSASIFLIFPSVSTPLTSLSL